MRCLWCECIGRDDAFVPCPSGAIVYNGLINGGAPWYARWFGILRAMTPMCTEYDEDAIVYKKHHLIKSYIFLGKEYLHEVY